MTAVVEMLREAAREADVAARAARAAMAAADDAVPHPAVEEQPLTLGPPPKRCCTFTKLFVATHVPPPVEAFPATQADAAPELPELSEAWWKRWCRLVHDPLNGHLVVVGAVMIASQARRRLVYLTPGTARAVCRTAFILACRKRMPPCRLAALQVISQHAREQHRGAGRGLPADISAFAQP